MDKVKVSIVSYLNSKPFLFGIDNQVLKDQVLLSLDIPSVCSKKLVNDVVDLGLVPIAVLPELKEYYIVSDYCIGSFGKVGSVMLYSEVPLKKINTILLDYQSQTSVSLVKVLAKFFWKIDPVWASTEVDYESKIKSDTAAVIIGDRTFGLASQYPYSYDLSEEWEKYTQLPFVFACWVANKQLPEQFLEQFNNALKFGLDNRESLITELNKK